MLLFRSLAFGSFLLLLLSGCSSVVPAGNYTEQVKLMYKTMESRPSSNVDSGVLKKQGDSDFVSADPGGKRDDGAAISALQSKLEEIEKAEGKMSVRAVPVLMRLNSLSGQDYSAKYKLQERALDITEGFCSSNKCSASDAAYLIPQIEKVDESWRMVAAGLSADGGGQAGSGSGQPGSGSGQPGSAAQTQVQDLSEKSMRLLYRLKLKAEGRQAVENYLPLLCEYLKAQSKEEEALTLYKDAVDYESTVEKEDKGTQRSQFLKNSYRSMLKAYLRTLQQAGKTAEARDYEQRLSELTTQMVGEAAVQAEAGVAAAKARAGTDPVGYASALLLLADVRLQQDRKPEAADLIRQAMSIYSTIESENDAADLSEFLWTSARQFLAHAQTKADESVIYDLADAYEKRQKSWQASPRGRDHLGKITTQFIDINRTASGIRFLKSVSQKRKQLWPGDRESGPDIDRHLREIYKGPGDYTDSELDKIGIAEEKNDQDQLVDTFLQISSRFGSQHKDAESKAVASRAFDTAMKMEKLSRADLQSRLVALLVKQNQLNEADGLIRHLAGLCPTANSPLLPDLCSQIDLLVDTYANNKELGLAESMLEFAGKSLPVYKEYRSKWLLKQADLCLQHAWVLKDQGKEVRADFLRGKSDMAFDAFLKTASPKADSAADIENLKKKREADLKRYGFFAQPGSQTSSQGPQRPKT
jgi:hypothetical protein